MATGKVSFDYDGTLSTEKGKEKARKLKEMGNTLYIITARQSSDSKAVYATADELGIPHSRVKFTNGKDKWPYIKALDIMVHYDNNQEQVDKINQNTDARAYLFED